MKLEIVGFIQQYKDWTGDDGIRRAQVTVSFGEHYPPLVLPWPVKTGTVLQRARITVEVEGD